MKKLPCASEWPERLLTRTVTPTTGALVVESRIVPVRSAVGCPGTTPPPLVPLPGLTARRFDCGSAEITDVITSDRASTAAVRIIRELESMGLLGRES